MYKNFNILIVLCVNCCLIYAAPQHQVFKQITEIPSDVPICSETDQDLNECIRKAFQEMLARSVNGIPELNIIPTDPLTVDKSSYEFTNNVIQGRVALRNIKIKGISKTIFNAVDYKRDGDKFTIQIKSKTPKLFIEGRYKAEVKINNAKLNSKGDFNVTMAGIDATTLSEAELYERDGHKYIRMTSFNLDATLENMRFFATGLMPDQILNDAALEFVNQNWRNIYKSLIRETRSTWEPEFLKISNEYFSHIPFDLLLKKD